MDYILSEILEDIIEFCDDESKIALIQTASWFSPMIRSLTVFGVIPTRCTNIVKLKYLSNTITNVSWMTKLKVLHAEGFCGITQASITGLNLVELHAQNNSTITDVS
jgi:hypothetical protein